ncbi:PIG-L family deacetylase [Actinoplanes sp. NPDC049548]|uniref:PIG-L deacetylase family protein n=1 Tax=Actinoplanes sp. NPDC049548 TaxID=3155152 RepID=UPI00342C8C7E
MTIADEGISSTMVLPQEPVLMAVHAHPGPESTNTGGTLAHYARQGVRVVLVTCTNGEYGTGPGGAMPGQAGHDPSAVAAVRLDELRNACAHLGVRDLEPLGYHDSGTQHRGAGAFSDVPVGVVAGRIATLYERYRPQVVVTYDPEARFHPDHSHTAAAAHEAADATGIPVKVYGIALGASYWRQVHEAAVPTAEAEHVDARITTTVDVEAVVARKQAAVLAHASQIRDTWIERLYAGELPEVLGRETYIRTRDRSGAPVPEDDLFAGVRVKG